jgi:hypothetical protein
MHTLADCSALLDELQSFTIKLLRGKLKCEKGGDFLFWGIFVDFTEKNCARKYWKNLNPKGQIEKPKKSLTFSY